jgi:hypothetical protein
VRRDDGPRRRAGVHLGGGRLAAGTSLIAAVLLGVPPGTSTAALSQEGGAGGGNRLREVERKVEDAEDVIVEEVLALRRRLEALETRVRLLEAELAELRRAPPPRR